MRWNGKRIVKWCHRNPNIEKALKEIVTGENYLVGQLKGHFGTIDSENRYIYFWQNKVFAYFCTFNNAERMILTYVYRNTTLRIISNFGGHSLWNIAKIKDFQSALSVAQIWAKWLRIKKGIARIVPFFTGKYALLLLAETR